MKRRTILAVGAALLVSATGAQAETLHVSGIYPAGSDEAVEIEAISVIPFEGVDGPRLSYAIEHRLRGVTIGAAPWFTVLSPQRADDADAVLEGYAQPRLSESGFRATRQVCGKFGPDGACILYVAVETDCLRLNLSLDPELRLVAYDGRLVWSSRTRRATEISFCPEFDAEPALEPIVDGWIEEIAAQARLTLAPRADARNVRIMEGRQGLEGGARRAFRNAVALTQSNQGAACGEFAALLVDFPQQPSLLFNTGLCAEQAGDLGLAQERYHLALGNDRSDDEAQAGLQRVNERLYAERQLDLRERALARRSEPSVLAAASPH